MENSIDRTNKPALKTLIEKTYHGRRLRDVNLYVSDYEVPFVNKQGWHLCDVALELQFDDETYFTFCFDPEWEVLDFFQEPFMNVVYETNARAIPQIKDNAWAPFRDNVLESIEIYWNWYEDFEENTYHIPQVMDFEFVDGKRFVVAAVQVIPEKDELVLHLDSEGDILIGFSEYIRKVLWEEVGMDNN